MQEHQKSRIKSPQTKRKTGKRAVGVSISWGKVSIKTVLNSPHLREWDLKAVLKRLLKLQWSVTSKVLCVALPRHMPPPSLIAAAAAISHCMWWHRVHSSRQWPVRRILRWPFITASPCSPCFTFTINILLECLHCNLWLCDCPRKNFSLRQVR